MDGIEGLNLYISLKDVKDNQRDAVFNKLQKALLDYGLKWRGGSTEVHRGGATMVYIVDGKLSKGNSPFSMWASSTKHGVIETVKAKDVL